MFGSRTPLADPPLPEHDDDWSDARLSTVHRQLTVAMADERGSDRVAALLDGVPDTSRNLASLIEHLVAEHARRVADARAVRARSSTHRSPTGPSPRSGTSWSCGG